MVPLGDVVHVAVVNHDSVVDRTVDGVDVEQSLTGRVAVGAFSASDSEVVNFFVCGRAVADSVVSVGWPRRKVATGRDDLTHIDAVCGRE